MATTAELGADAHVAQAASAGTACLPSPAGAIRLRMRWFGSTISVRAARAFLYALGRGRRPRIHQAERAPDREAGVDKHRKRQSEALGGRKVGGRRLGRDCEELNVQCAKFVVEIAELGEVTCCAARTGGGADEENAQPPGVGRLGERDPPARGIDPAHVRHSIANLQARLFGRSRQHRRRPSIPVAARESRKIVAPATLADNGAPPARHRLGGRGASLPGPGNFDILPAAPPEPGPHWPRTRN